MPRADAIKVQGTVVEVLAEALFRVELRNRHRVLGLVPRRALGSVRLQVGESVILEMSPYDFSKGRLVLE